MTRRACLFAVAGLGLLLVAVVADIAQGSRRPVAAHGARRRAARPRHARGALVRDVRLPRAVAGIVAGGALGAAAVLLIAITRNPLAEPATLGLTAGGTLAVTVTSAYASVAPGASTIAVAFVGVVFGALLIGAIASVAGAAPVRIVLAGMAISLALAAVSAAIQLLQGDRDERPVPVGRGQPAAVRLGTGPGGGADRRRGARRLLRPGARARRRRARREHGAGAGAAQRGDAAAVGRRRHAADRGGRRRRRADRVRRRAVGRDRPRGAPARPRGAAGDRHPLGGGDRRGRRRRRPADLRPRRRDARRRHLRADRRAGADRRGQAPARRWCAGRRRRRERRALAPARRRAGRRRRARGGVREPLPRRAVGRPAARSCARSSGRARGSATSCSSCARRGCASRCSPARAWRRRASSCRRRCATRSPGRSSSGVTGGASVAAFIVLLALPAAPRGVLPFAAFAGGVAAMMLVLVLAGSGRGSPQRLALVGLAVSAACLAVTTLLVLNAEPAASVAVTWLAGSTYAQSWSELQLLAIPALVLLPLAALAVRRLDVLMLDDELGTDARPARRPGARGAADGGRRARRRGRGGDRRDRVRRPARPARRAAHRRRQPPAAAAGGDDRRRHAAGDRRRARADPLPADRDPVGPRRRDDRRAVPQLDDVARTAGGGVTVARAARSSGMHSGAPLTGSAITSARRFSTSATSVASTISAGGPAA